MRKPWQISAVYFAFLVVVFAVMTWITRTVLHLENINAEIQRKAETEEIVRLALWRIDAAVLPLIIEESSRPYFEYNPYNKIATIMPNAAPDQQDQVLPSPLLMQTSQYVNVYFQYEQQKKGKPKLASPQVLTGEVAQWAGRNWEIDNDLDGNYQRLNEFATNVNFSTLNDNLSRQQSLPVQQMETANFPQQDINAPLQQGAEVFQTGQQAAQERQEDLKNAVEYSSRMRQVQKINTKIQSSKQQYYDVQQAAPGVEPQAANQSGWQQQSERQDQPAQTETINPSDNPPRQEEQKIHEDAMKLSWNGDMLVMARNVKVEGQEQVQGAWLNWESLRNELLEEVRDILPEAELVPADPEKETNKSRMLAYMPARLIPGKPAIPMQVLASPLRIPLTAAWICVILAVSSIGILLKGTVALSERRGAFVSAVTHELRTPLTTFKMYTEMLAGGMITDDQKRQEYLNTLYSESTRLGHLVENVLSYARLEKGTGTRVLEETSPEHIIDRCRDRLNRHAHGAGMELSVECFGSAAIIPLKTDPRAIEQILFNLIDNACKYASGGEDNRIHLAVDVKGRNLIFRVSDHGSGLSRQEISTVFKPFRKSAKKAAQSAPGVGLGLALCRNLARQLGGDLVYEDLPDRGACFALKIRAET